MYDITNFVENGDIADILKRSLFYKEEIEKGKNRGLAATVKNKKIYDEIKVQTLLESKDGNREKISLSQEKIHIIHAMMGLISEAGEILEEVIKSSLENRELNKDNLKEESGDLLWYIALLLRNVGSDFETEAKRNTDKLFARYPEKFTSEKALNRDLEKEQEVLTA